MLNIIKSKSRKFYNPKEGIYTFLNPYSYLLCREYKEIYKDFDGIYIDGSLLVSLLRAMKVKKVNRVSFDYTSIAGPVFERLNKLTSTVAIIGSDQTSNENFCCFLRDKYPNIKIVINNHGYLGTHERLELLNNIIVNKVEFVLVGMGTPRQDNFLVDLKRMGWKGLGYTCGGFIHQTGSQGGCYYPKLINKLNLRFLYRMYDEPKLIIRYFINYPYSIFIILKDKIFNSKKEN